MSREERGELINLLEVSSGKLVINEVVKNIFDKVGDKEVLIYSINGYENEGKSFLANCMRSYLENKSSQNPDVQWLADFTNEFQSRRRDHTTLLQIWSKPFIIDLDQNKSVAVFLMDTEACFRTSDSFIYTAKLATLSLSISSTFIYNARYKVEQDEYMIISLLTKFVTLLWQFIYGIEKIPFQDILFLLRDSEKRVPDFIDNMADGIEHINLRPGHLEYIFSNISSFFKQTNTYYMLKPDESFLRRDNFDLAKEIKSSSMTEFFQSVHHLFDIIFSKEYLSKQIGVKKGTKMYEHINHCIENCENIIIRELPEDVRGNVTNKMEEVAVYSMCDLVLEEYKFKMIEFERGINSKQYIRDNKSTIINNLDEYHQKNLEIFQAKFESLAQNNRNIYSYLKIFRRHVESFYMTFKKDLEHIISLTAKEIEIDELKEKLSKKEIELTEFNIQISKLNDEKDKEIAELRRSKISISRYLGRKFIYPMNSKPRGLCITLTNTIFPKGRDRMAAEPQMEELKKTFGELFNFQIVSEQNKTGYEIIQFLKECAQKTKKEHCALVVIISSHGNEQGVCGKNFNDFAPVKDIARFNDIIEIFNTINCPQLKGKPKMIFFLCCRGSGIEKVISANSNNQSERPIPIQVKNEESSETKNYPIGTECLMANSEIKSERRPNFSDMLICYSAVHGHVSWFNSQTGALLGEELNRNLRLFARSYDIETILKLTIDKLHQREIRNSVGILDAIQNANVELRGWTKFLYFFEKD